MGLADVFAAVQQRMTDVLAALVPPVALPVFLVGADKLYTQNAPNRVVWVPTSETILGPHAQGGDGVRNPRPLRTRHCMVQVHVWGSDPAGLGDTAADIAATELVLGHLVAAINDVCHGAWDAKGGSWGAGEAAVTSLGTVYVLALEVQIPLTRELDTYATVTTMPITPVVTPQVPTG